MDLLRKECFISNDFWTMTSFAFGVTQLCDTLHRDTCDDVRANVNATSIV